MSLILTLRFDEDSQSFFETKRKRHFPPERNQIPAHLTLFHHLPATPDVMVSIEQEAAVRNKFALEVTGLRSLGRGVAYTLASPPLLEAHRCLSALLDGHLIPQDRQRFVPHVVVQNKVTGDQARALLESLRSEFIPWSAQACGFDLWEYLGGPWRHSHFFHFQPEPGHASLNLDNQFCL